MKKSAYIFSLGLLLVMAACNKKLDVLPQNEITPDQIKTSSDVLAILAGGYSQMQNSAAFGEKFIDMPDLIASADQVNCRGTFNTYKNIYQLQTTATNGVCADMWG